MLTVHVSSLCFTNIHVIFRDSTVVASLIRRRYSTLYSPFRWSKTLYTGRSRASIDRPVRDLEHSNFQSTLHSYCTVDAIALLPFNPIHLLLQL